MPISVACFFFRREQNVYFVRSVTEMLARAKGHRGLIGAPASYISSSEQIMFKRKGSATLSSCNILKKYCIAKCHTAKADNWNN